jgi:3-oxoacyl-[acyl-carrier protein] reductase
VVNYSKSAAEAEETLKAVKAAGAEGIVDQASVAEDADCRRMAKAALDKWGRIDILVNNAGTTKIVPHADLEAMATEEFYRIYGVNVVGTFQMVRACAEAMKKTGDAAVVNVSSTAGIAGNGSSIAYAASKGALNTMTLSLARALAPAIRVNTVNPGFVSSEWFKRLAGQDGFQKLNDSTAALSPLGRTSTSEEIARAIIFLCGPESRNMTGELMRMDAGVHLNGGVRR